MLERSFLLKEENKMKPFWGAVLATLLFTGIVSAEDRGLNLSNSPDPAIAGQIVRFTCEATGDWRNHRITKAQLTLRDASGAKLINRASMIISGNIATYGYKIASNAKIGKWQFECRVSDGKESATKKREFYVTGEIINRLPVANPGGPYTGSVGQAVSFNGSGSSDPDGDTLTYSWNFGDNSSGSGATPTHTYASAGTFTVTLTVNDGKGGSNAKQTTATISAATGGHASIQSYSGPATCIACHPAEAQEMLASLHMKWAGPTPELTNSGGKQLGKQVGGINTFCTYAVSSKNACYNCHVRIDGNAAHPASASDVDCLMCHSDVYARKFVPDPNTTQTVTNILGETKTYMFTMMDNQGNYVSEPDFANMPAGTTMTDLAKNVHLPTRKSCLKCHAKAGGGDWTKRGDIGANSANPTVEQDFHMSQAGANLSCADCHAKGNHLIGGRGIDLRQTEAPDPKCSDCHSSAPHASTTINRHATGQVGCQVCHIRSFGKGGATELARDWEQPEWNAGFCNGQGGFVGHETKMANVLPEYRFFDGTSYVYNVGETISPNADGTYTMAKANGAIFDGKSKIVPIKDHWSVMAVSTDGKIVPPVIMDMFMIGSYANAILAGMDEQGMPGAYKLVQANAEMLITHGVDPKSNAPSCASCHTSSGKSNLMIPFAELGYHKFLSGVESCTKCHGKKTAGFTTLHDEHVRDEKLSCTQCHTK
jgi:PKD repeat protein